MQKIPHSNAKKVNLRNEFNFWNVHGIMNTSGLLLSIITPVSLLANECDVRSVLHEQVTLAAVNQILCNS